MNAKYESLVVEMKFEFKKIYEITPFHPLYVGYIVHVRWLQMMLYKSLGPLSNVEILGLLVFFF